MPPKEGTWLSSTASDVDWDPYDVAINADPYAVFRRLRDEAPLYRNEEHDFYALSRWDDVEWALKERDTFLSCRGNVLEIIKAGVEQPPGTLIFEDPPVHTIHRSLLSRAFTPKRMAALEPEIRAFTAECLDPLVGAGGFDFVADLGALVPMQVIGMLLGIPEADQRTIRDEVNASLRTEPGKPMRFSKGSSFRIGNRLSEIFGEYIDWRAEHPSDDVITALLTAEFEDEHGVTRCLTRDEALLYVNVVAGAGNETTNRLIGWAGKVLGEHPDQRRELAADPSLVPNAVEELLRYEDARSDHRPLRGPGRRDPRPGRAGRQRHVAARPRRQPRRAAVPGPRPVRHPPADRPAPDLRPRHPLLPRRGARRGSRAGSPSRRC